MTPELLARYLDELRGRGVMHANLTFATPSGDSVSINVTMGPDSMPLPGDAPTPGAWKSLPRLDDIEQYQDAP